MPTAFGLLAPSELLDPRNNLLSYIFGGEDRFPAQQCSTEEWLAMLGALGMKTQVDRDAFLQCAKKVEALGASTSDRPPPDVRLSLDPTASSHSSTHPAPLSARRSCLARASSPRT